MYWHQQQPIAQLIFLNFQKLMSECIQLTSPDTDYFFEKAGEDFYYSSQILFPLMNGIFSNAYQPLEINERCEKLKDKFKNANYPVTWFWPHDMDIPQDVESVFKNHGFNSMGRYTSVAVNGEKIRCLPAQMSEGVTIDRVETDKQFKDFLQINQVVYGMPADAMTAVARLYGAYKHSDNMRLYLASVDGMPASTLFGYQNENTLGLYSGATLESYRKRGLLTALIIHAVKNTTQIEYVVAQLMAAQMAKGVCDQLGFQEYSHFTPLCYGFDLSQVCG